MTDEEQRTEAAILEHTRRLQGDFEPRAGANARLRLAVKRFETSSATAGSHQQRAK